MLHFLRLTRPLNLLIIVLTMVAMRYGVIAGNLEKSLNDLLLALESDVTREALILPAGFGPGLPLHLFILLILSTVLIAAGGNVINDYFDTRIDRINKPDEVIVGRQVKRREAMMGHLALSGLGLILGMFVAWQARLPYLALIPAFAIGALWSYSTTFKRRLFVGNGAVATLTGLVPLTVGLYEIPLMERNFSIAQVVTIPTGEAFEMEPAFGDLWSWILVYTAFAFISTLVRELQKDMADVKGDEADGCRTVPIAWGMAWARGLSLFYIVVLVLGALLLRATFLRDPLSFWYIGIAVVVPLLLSAGFTYSAHSRKEHVRAGNLMKLAMVLAVAYAMLIRFTH